MRPAQVEAAAVGQHASDTRVLREVTAAAAAVFTEPQGRWAAAGYLYRRGIDARQLSPLWLIGYAPPVWTHLVDRLAGAFPEQALLDAGVVRLSSRGTLIDVFRDRVMFGIRDAGGTLAGFIGRDLSGHPGAPKYLNTRQHALFTKSNLLYGLHADIHEAGHRQPVVVEGPLDVLAIAARQQREGGRDLLPIAACGTALTDGHASTIASLINRPEASVVLALDADPAGRSATLAAGERLRAAGLDVRVTLLPAGSDPADYLSRRESSLDVFRAEHALPLLHVHVEHAIANQGDRMQWVEGRLAALRSLTSHLASYPPNDTARQIGWLADALHLDRTTVTFELADAYLKQPEPIPTRTRRAAVEPISFSI